jgi:carboxyl-terminal processing protease
MIAKAWNSLPCAVVLAFGLIVLPYAVSAEDALVSVPLVERVTIATQLYNSVATYYAHAKAAPEFDLDKDYKIYLDQILGSDDRRNFSLASAAFLAKLNNGHSNFFDEELYRLLGRSFGFYARPLQGRWVVFISRIDRIKPGDIISTIDGQDFNVFFQTNRQYVSGSSDADRAAHFFYRRHLFPQNFTLGLEDGRRVKIERLPPESQSSQDDTTEVREEGGYIYIRIPSFEDSKYEDAAVAAVKEHLNTRAIIIDVRGNGGGSTPNNLLSVLMDRAYQEWSETTPVRMGVLELYQDVGLHPDLHWSAPVLMPAEIHYNGRVLILTDVRCFSACEDFVEPFKVNHRATILGEHTAGSTGQPYSKNLGNGFSFRVGAKREYFPDGAEFEGIGVMPDIAIEPTPADLRTGSDPVLAMARSLIKSGSSGQHQ